MFLANESPVGTLIALDVQCEVNEAVTFLQEALAGGTLPLNLSGRVEAWLGRNM